MVGYLLLTIIKGNLRTILYLMLVMILTMRKIASVATPLNFGRSKLNQKNQMLLMPHL